MKDLINILKDGRHSLVVCKDEIRTFDGRGIIDLFRLVVEKSVLLHGASVADKVVGKAAASLMILAKIDEAYAEVISQSALDLLTGNGISVKYGSLVPHIKNTAGNGLCPLEMRCMKCVTPEECFVTIRAFVDEMKTNKPKE